MASKAKTTDQTKTSGRDLAARALPFVGLFVSVPVMIAGSVALHMAVAGSGTGQSLTTAGLTLAAGVLTAIAWAAGASRRALIRWQVTVSTALTSLAVMVTVAVGSPRWWMLTYTVIGVVVAASWALHRVDALRQDRGTEREPDKLTAKLGLEGTRFRRPVHHYDRDGNLTRVEVPLGNAPGATAATIQAAVPGIESAAAQATGLPVPAGRSRAVPVDAGNTNLVIVTKDVLVGDIVWPGPSHPGQCITAAPLRSGVAEDGQPLLKYIAGGNPLAPNPSSYGYMGMTRTGKTMGAQINALEMMSRKHVVIFWFDTVKGAQTVLPMRDGLDIIVADDNPSAFRAGMRALEKLVRWRAGELGRHGYRAWTAKAAEDKRLRMPLLVAHFEEADELCKQAGAQLVWLASKGLSTGVLLGVSLQRADAESMPTGLRFNIGDWSCYGCGDDYSAGFALSDATIAAGARPENWKQSKPGYHYHEGPGVDEQRWPVAHKSHLASDDQMRAHAAQYGPQMTPLDAGSIAALGDWYVGAKQKMTTLTQEADTTVTSTNTPPHVADGDPDDTTVSRQEVDEEVRQAVADGEVPAQADAEAGRIDPTAAVPPPPAGTELSWSDGKAAAPTAEAAAEAFDRALRELLDDSALRTDPDSPDSVVFAVGVLLDRYPFRSRPWFSSRLSKAADGEIAIPPGLVLERGDKDGQYRLQRLAAVTALPHAQ